MTFHSSLTYEELESTNFLTMDGGQLHAAFCSLITLSLENSTKAEEVQKKLSVLESQHELSEDFNERMKLRVEMLSLKREEKINGIRSRAIDKLASRLQTTLRTFGGR